jgi:CPA2 family monovalent cation:H+ antiporter-2
MVLISLASQGAFLAGLLLSETSYRYQVEADIAPFRGLLLGLFFITVGFSIDLALLRSDLSTILAMLCTMICGKAAITTLVARCFGVSLAAAQRTGLLTAQVRLVC